MKKVCCGIRGEFLSTNDIRQWLEFEGVSMENYSFISTDSSVLFNGQKMSLPPKYNYTYFKELLNSPIIILELLMCLYPQPSCEEMIHSYEDFKRSACVMIVLLFDSCYVDIYCKNQEWIEILYRNALRIPNAKVERIYEGLDDRSGMYI